MITSAQRISFTLRLCLLIVCCALFLPQNFNIKQYRHTEENALRCASMPLAISAIENPLSSLLSLREQSSSLLRTTGKRNSLLKHSSAPSGPSDASCNEVEQPSLPPILFAERLLGSVPTDLSFTRLPISWFALAPPSSPLC